MKPSKTNARSPSRLPRLRCRARFGAVEYLLLELRAMAQLYAARGVSGWESALGHVDAALDELRKIR